MSEVFDRKTRSLINVAERRLQNFCTFKNALVIGCGTGHEAGFLARSKNLDVIGIDIEEQFKFDHVDGAPATLKRMDARKIDFADATFDLIYSFHAIEHIPDLHLALREMERVLRPGGGYIIGTPNKRRILGYIGSDVPIASKIKWNIADLKMRLAGRWSNEEGAHAGFKRAELMEMALSTFGAANDITNEYYYSLYGNSKNLIRILEQTGALEFVLPCVYVCGSKAK